MIKFADKIRSELNYLLQEQEEVATSLKVDLKEYSDKGHFMSFSFPDLLQEIKDRIL